MRVLLSGLTNDCFGASIGTSEYRAMDRDVTFNMALDDACTFVQCTAFFKNHPASELYHVVAYSHIDIDGSSKVEFDVSYHAIDTTDEQRLSHLLRAKLLGIDSYPAAVEG